MNSPPTPDPFTSSQFTPTIPSASTPQPSQHSLIQLHLSALSPIQINSLLQSGIKPFLQKDAIIILNNQTQIQKQILHISECVALFFVDIVHQIRCLKLFNSVHSKQIESTKKMRSYTPHERKTSARNSTPIIPSTFLSSPHLSPKTVPFQLYTPFTSHIVINNRQYRQYLITFYQKKHKLRLEKENGVFFYTGSDSTNAPLSQSAYTAQLSQPHLSSHPLPEMTLIDQTTPPSNSPKHSMISPFHTPHQPIHTHHSQVLSNHTDFASPHSFPDHLSRNSHPSEVHDLFLVSVAPSFAHTFQTQSKVLNLLQSRYQTTAQHDQGRHDLHSSPPVAFLPSPDRSRQEIDNQDQQPPNTPHLLLSTPQKPTPSAYIESDLSPNPPHIQSLSSLLHHNHHDFYSSSPTPTTTGQPIPVAETDTSITLSNLSPALLGATPFQTALSTPSIELDYDSHLFTLRTVQPATTVQEYENLSATHIQAYTSLLPSIPELINSVNHLAMEVEQIGINIVALYRIVQKESGLQQQPFDDIDPFVFDPDLM